MTDQERDKLLIDVAIGVEYVKLKTGVYTITTMGTNWSCIAPAFNDRLEYLKSLRSEVSDGT